MRRGLWAGGVAALLMAGGLYAVAADAATTGYEAESAQLSGGTRVETEHAGFTGSGYVGGFVDANRGAATVSFAVTSAAAGSNTLALRYANGTGSPRTMSLIVNGVTRQVSFPATAGWAGWGTTTQPVTLNRGANTVAVRFGASDNGNLNLDGIAVTPAAAPADGVLEAESSALSGGAVAETEHPGFTGAGYAGGFTDPNKGNATASFAVTAAAAGNSAVTIRYANGTGSTRTMSFVVNGATRQISLPATANWDTWGAAAATATLAKGANTLAIRYGSADSGNINLDSIAVGPVSTDPPPTPGTGLELESGFLDGGATVATNVAGYTGAGFVNVASAGARVIRTVNLPAAGAVTVSVRFRNATGSARQVAVQANGLPQGQLPLPAGDGWQTAQRDLPLRAGVNIVGLQPDGGVQLDNLAVAGSVPLAERGATLPYTTYEAEAGATTGGVLPASREYMTEQAEASGRRAVKLTGTGQYVEVTLTGPANAITVRAGIPDNSTSPLAVLAGGSKVADLQLTSKYSWMYGPYPFQGEPGGERPHRFFDDARVLLPQTYPAGTKIRLVKESSATPYVTVDLLDAEVAEAAQPAPAGYVSVTSHGAVANDAGDDLTAFRAAVSAAQSSSSKGLWIPAGRFVLSGLVNVAGIDVRGAGIWHTVLAGQNRRGGIYVTGGNTQIGDFTIDGDVTTRDPDCCANSDAALEGEFGTGSLIRNVATNHAKVGLWVKAASGLYAVGLRIRNTMADGANINGNTGNVRVEQSTTRNTGDDGLALWSWTGAGTVRDSVLAYNTLSLPILANGAAIYGGVDNRIEDNLITDIVFQGSGITISSWHDPFPFGGTTIVQRNTLTRTGSYSLDWGSAIGALWVYAPANPITAPIVFRDLQVNDSSYQGFLASWQVSVGTLTFDRVAFNGTGTAGLEFNAPGSGTFSYVTVTGNGGPGLVNNSGFQVSRGPDNSGW
ncbi:CBM35 domain-containing protein [Actinoplanes sp. NPDC051633]|uniref:CBM35 domain-containing protein n=1 Tax=Actinoplanes sp. NPDC051633 TaxID=3155670 RepID=UPI003444F08D